VCDLEQLYTVYSTVHLGYLFTVLAAIKVKNSTLAFLYACSIMCGMKSLLTLFYIYAGFLLIQILLFLTINDLVRNIAEMLILGRATHFQQPRKRQNLFYNFIISTTNLSILSCIFSKLTKDSSEL
jgi:hypothetical protein